MHLQLLFLSALISLTVYAQPPSPTYSNVSYGPHEQNKLDVWLPNSDKPTPVLIFFHGGGFVAGSKSLTSLQKECLQAGIAAISANYRLTKPEGITVEHSMLDGARAVQFVRSMSAAWMLNPDQIALQGSSAGGALGLWITLHDDLADATSTDPVLRFSTRVSCMIAQNTPVTLDSELIIKTVGGNPLIHPAVPSILDVASTAEATTQPRAQALVAEYSPFAHASAGDPPVMLLYSKAPPEGLYPADTPFGISIHSAKFGILMKKRLDELGVPCQLGWPGAPANEEPLQFLQHHLQEPAE